MEQQHPLHILIGTLALGALVFFGLNAPQADTQIAKAQSAGTEELRGWGWSDTTGWISFSCENEDDDTECADSDYGVTIDIDTGAFSGTAWSQHAGWISFDRSATGNPPSSVAAPGTTDPGSGSGAIAQFDPDGTVLGWMRALAACEETPCTDDGPGSESGDWDGWISLSDTTRTGNVTLEDDTLQGFAWGSEVVGWVTMGAIFDPEDTDQDDDGVPDEEDETNNVFVGNNINEIGFTGQLPDGTLVVTDDKTLDTDGDGVPDYLDGVCTFTPLIGTPDTDVTWTVHEDLISGGIDGEPFLFSWNLQGNPSPTPPSADNPGAASSVTTKHEQGIWQDSTATVHSGFLATEVPCVSEEGFPRLTIVQPNTDFTISVTPQSQSRLVNTVPQTATYTVSASGAQDLGDTDILVVPTLPAGLAGHASISPSSGTITHPSYDNQIEFTITINGNPDSIRGTHSLQFTGTAVDALSTAVANLVLTKSTFQEF